MPNLRTIFQTVCNDVIGAVRQQEFLLSITINNRRGVALFALRPGIAGATDFPDLGARALIQRDDFFAPPV